MDRKGEAEDGGRSRLTGRPAGDPGAERAASGNQRQPGELGRAKAFDDREPGRVQLRRRSGSAPARHAVGLLHERNRDLLRERGLGRGDQVGSRYPAARAVAEDERRSWPVGRMEVDVSGPVRGVDFEHRPMVGCGSSAMAMHR